MGSIITVSSTNDSTGIRIIRINDLNVLSYENRKHEVELSDSALKDEILGFINSKGIEHMSSNDLDEAILYAFLNKANLEFRNGKVRIKNKINPYKTSKPN